MAREQTVKVTVRLFAEDVEQLKQFFPKGGYNKPVRECVRALVRTLNTRTHRQFPQVFDQQEEERSTA